MLALIPNVPIIKRSPLIDSKAKVGRPLFVKRCLHLGPLLTHEEIQARQLAGCRTCDNRIYVHHCTLPNAKKFNDGPYCRVMGECRTCPDRVTSTRPSIRYDEHSLARNYNACIIPGKADYLMAYRSKWNNSDVSLVRLDADFKPYGDHVQLRLDHPNKANAGREDPRLFRHKGQLHVSYTGWMGHTRDWSKANMLFARINEETFETEDIFYPQIPGRQSWEKNHVYFDVGDELYLVYSISPHKVMKVLCEQIVDVWETPTATTWKYGHLRGGAAPVLHNGEFYHFFHGCIEPEGKRVYSIGVAVFEAKPPFRITRMTNTPIDVADRRPRKQDIEVLFPCGAFFQDGQWCVTSGVHDGWSELRFYPEEWVERQLEAV